MERQRSEFYCLYRIQAEKRIAKGETASRLERCLKHCTGYNNRCENYTPRGKYRK